MSEAAIKVREVIARLEAWQEGENRIAEEFGGSEESFTAEAAENRRDNYGELIKILTAAVQGIEGNEQREHPSGAEAYKALSRALNTSVTSPWLEDFIGAFKGEHSTLQASLYRTLNQAMRESHRFFEDPDNGGKVTCFDGRIAGSLPEFIVNGFIPYI